METREATCRDAHWELQERKTGKKGKPGEMEKRGRGVVEKLKSLERPNTWGTLTREGGEQRKSVSALLTKQGSATEGGVARS